MDIIDRTTVSDDELQAALERLVAVVDGLVPFDLHCTCGRHYRLRAKEEMAALLSTIRRAMRERTGEELVADTSWYSLIEVD